MKKVTFILTHLIFCFLLIIPHRALSQGNNDPCGCNSVLINGVMRERIQKGSNESRDEVYSYIASLNFDEALKKYGQNASGIIPGAGIFGADNSYEKKRESFSQFQKKYKKNDYAFSINSLIDRSGDPVVLAAWNKCKEDCNAVPIVTLFHTFSDTDSINYELVIMVNNLPSGQKDLFEVNFSLLNNAICEDGNAPSGKIVPDHTKLNMGENRFSIRRVNSNSPIRGSLKIAGFDQSFYIPKYVSPLSKPILEPIVYGANEINFDERAYLKVENGVVMSDIGSTNPKSGGPANFLWDISVPVSGEYRISIYVSNSYSEPLKIYVIKDGSVSDPNINPFSMLTVYPGSKDVYTWVNMPVTVSLLANKKTKIRFHAPREQYETKHLPYFKAIKLTISDE